MFQLKFFWILSVFVIVVSQSLFALAYRVEFQGEMSEEVRSSLEHASQLIALKNTPPPSLIALKKRSEADLLNLVTALRGFAYFDPDIKLQYREVSSDEYIVIFLVTPGRAYPLLGNVVEFTDLKEGEIRPDVDVDLLEGEPALPKVIFEVQNDLIEELEKQGYPLVSIDKREVIVDQEKKGVRVTFFVKLGPKARFGAVEIKGLRKVVPEFVFSKIAWCRGETYQPCLIDATELALEKTGLFSSIVIEQSESATDDGELPMQLILQEGYHRTFASGISINTQLGPGVFTRWENRNICGLGRRLSFEADLWLIKQDGILRYTIPDWRQNDQTLTWTAQVEREVTKGFTDIFYSFFGNIERKIDPSLKVAYGAGFKRIFTSDSNNNRSALLFKVPLMLRWSTACPILDPVQGQTLRIEAIPAWQILGKQFGYSTELATWSYYIPVTEKQHVFAFKTVFGTILGASDFLIPPPERLYSGTESTLRGYKYMTVSPLNHEGKPIGGLSMLVFSGEARLRLKKDLGFVAFYEVGNVYKDRFPDIASKQLQSLGIGLRYHTILGPIRGDIAVPLNKRPIDNAFQFYFSIGQAF